MRLSKILAAAICGMFCLCSCGDSALNKVCDEFIGDSIIIPFEKMNKCSFSMYADTTRVNRDYKLVSYMKMEGCSNCKISALCAMDNMSSEKDCTYRLEPIYIIEVSPKEIDFVYAELCKSRIKSPVYLDTCGFFKQANPELPNNPLFHTFVLNKKDVVVLVGNPYKNKKMTELLDKVLKENH